MKHRKRILARLETIATGKIPDVRDIIETQFSELVRKKLRPYEGIMDDLDRARAAVESAIRKVKEMK